MSDYKEIIVKEYHNEKGLLTRRQIGEEIVRCKNCMHNGSFDTEEIEEKKVEESMRFFGY